MLATNSMNLGPILAHPNSLPILLELSEIEQIMILPIYISIAIVYVKGAQQQYKGYVITFLRNVPNVVDKLLYLLRKCSIVIVKPQQTLVNQDVQSTKQFRRTFRVSQQKVQVFLSQYIGLVVRTENANPLQCQLDFLIRNYEGFRDVSVDYDLLS